MDVGMCVSMVGFESNAQMYISSAWQTLVDLQAR